MFVLTKSSLPSLIFVSKATYYSGQKLKHLSLESLSSHVQYF
jgi:hypothetical protein